MYDVVIVGAGSAGASAALEFARRSNLHILLIDKAMLPREKPCGGAMPSSVEKLLDLDLSPIIKNRTQILKLYHSYENEVLKKTLKSNAPMLIDRLEFDMFLLDKACAIALEKIEVWDNSAVKSIVEKEAYVHIELDDGQEVQAKYLIAADGALGKTASMVGLMKKRRFAQSFDAEITTDDQYYNDHQDTMVMNYFCLPHGYGWIFPKEKNRFSCGVGTWGKPLNLKRELDDFIGRSFPKENIENIEVRGFPIPVYQGTQRISTNRVLLAGDAAGLVDPVSGEGIRFALHSGKIAANVITKAFKDLEMKNNSVAGKYQKIIHDKIGKELKAKLSFVSLAFHNNPNMFYKTFVKNRCIYLSD